MAYTRASDGIRLHYEVVGRRGGEPVLMIQGLGADKQRLEPAAHGAGAEVPHHRARQPRRRTQ